MKIKISNIIILIGVAGFFQSCKVTEAYQNPIDINKTENFYRQKTNNDSISTASVAWNQIFTDDKLQAIIKKTIENNLDLKIAITNIQEADAAFKQSKLQNLPSLDSYASIKDTKNSGAAQQGSTFVMPDLLNYQLGITAGWEVDIWDRIKSLKRSAYANFLQTDAAKRAVQTQLVAQAANLYYQLLSLDKQLEITKQTIKLREKNVETAELLMESAYLTGADVEQSKANLYSAQLMVPDLEIQIQQVENALNVLMNEAPKSIDRNSLDSQIVYSDLKTGVPASLLQNRPDVLAAEYAFRAAFESKNVALAQLYPSLNLSGTIGLSTRLLENFFTNSLFYSIGGALTQNIFQNGNRKAQIKIADARKERAYYNFEKALLNAGSEVSNALYSYQKATEKESTRTLQIQSLEKAVEYNQELLTYSSKANYINVLTAEQSLLQAKLAAVNDKLQQLQAVTDFYRAIGGGQF